MPENNVEKNDNLDSDVVYPITSDVFLIQRYLPFLGEYDQVNDPTEAKKANLLQRGMAALANNLREYGKDKKGFMMKESNSRGVNVFKKGNIVIVCKGSGKGSFSSRFFLTNDQGEVAPLFYIANGRYAEQVLDSSSLIPFKFGSGTISVSASPEINIPPEKGNTTLKEFILRLADGENVDIDELKKTYTGFVQRFDGLEENQRPIFSRFAAPVNELGSDNSANATETDLQDAERRLNEIMSRPKEVKAVPVTSTSETADSQGQKQPSQEQELVADQSRRQEEASKQQLLKTTTSIEASKKLFKTLGISNFENIHVFEPEKSNSIVFSARNNDTNPQNLDSTQIRPTLSLGIHDLDNPPGGGIAVVVDKKDQAQCEILEGAGFDIYREDWSSEDQGKRVYLLPVHDPRLSVEDIRSLPDHIQFEKLKDKLRGLSFGANDEIMQDYIDQVGKNWETQNSDERKKTLVDMENKVENLTSNSTEVRKLTQDYRDRKGLLTVGMEDKARRIEEAMSNTTLEDRMKAGGTGLLGVMKAAASHRHFGRRGEEEVSKTVKGGKEEITANKAASGFNKFKARLNNVKKENQSQTSTGKKSPVVPGNK